MSPSSLFPARSYTRASARSTEEEKGIGRMKLFFKIVLRFCCLRLYTFKELRQHPFSSSVLSYRTMFWRENFSLPPLELGGRLLIFLDTFELLMQNVECLLPVYEQILIIRNRLLILQTTSERLLEWFFLRRKKTPDFFHIHQHVVLDFVSVYTM